MQLRRLLGATPELASGEGWGPGFLSCSVWRSIFDRTSSTALVQDAWYSDHRRDGRRKKDPWKKPGGEPRGEGLRVLIGARDSQQARPQAVRLPVGVYIVQPEYEMGGSPVEAVALRFCHGLSDIPSL